ncbi:ubiquinol--cytochrome-c reductase subunit 10 [Sporobolomyces koalae]|uniref:ubiquinol--cytochrome-c reductase subunit 10 n=1 Tax=Sporobolomyces koalae TaxID=500713 RepID=UPI0031703879
MPAPRFAPKVKSAPSVAGLTPQFVVGRLAPNLAMWGAAGLGALFVFGAGIPLFRQDVFYPIGLKSIFEDKTPDSDKPF